MNNSVVTGSLQVPLSYEIIRLFDNSYTGDSGPE
jgi:hypothetical protein